VHERSPRRGEQALHEQLQLTLSIDRGVGRSEVEGMQHTTGAVSRRFMTSSSWRSSRCACRAASPLRLSCEAAISYAHTLRTLSLPSLKISARMPGNLVLTNGKQAGTSFM